MAKLLIICTILSCFVLTTTFAAIDADVQNKNVDRTIDLTSQIVKISYKITLNHKLKKNINAYEFVIPAEERDYLAYISMKDSSKKELKYSEKKGVAGTVFTVNLPAGAPTQVLYIETHFTKSIQPYPTEILQSDKQLVRYFGNAYYYSSYPTLTQKTTIHLSSRNVESFTNVKPSTQSDTTITYGPYDNIPGMLRMYNIL